MQVSHQTIYQSLYVQGRGALRKELARYLRRSHRRKGKHLQGRLRGMVMVSERPAEAQDRAVPGHWEGDLILGKNGSSAIGTLVERHSRYVMLLRLPKGRTAEEVCSALTSRIKTLPQQLWRSLTWDQGKEMALHAQFTVDTGVQVYFCDPHSPWQRGSNENTNGLLRQYFPKNLDLRPFTQRQLNHVAAELNTRPRQTLGWRTPSQVLSIAVATTA
jgi:IS30 family transposase